MAGKKGFKPKGGKATKKAAPFKKGGGRRKSYPRTAKGKKK